MAGDWIKLEHTTPDKPEVVSMAAKLSLDQDAVVGKLVRIWVWADQNSLNGNALTVTDAFLDRVTACPGFAGALREVGWLSGRQGLLTIPNFDRHNGQTAKARAVTNRRVARHRDKSESNAASVTPVTPKPLQEPLPEKRREEAETSGAQAREAQRHLPPELDTPTFRKAWEAWLVYWSLSFANGRPMQQATADSHLRILFGAKNDTEASQWLNTAIERGLRAPAAPKAKPGGAGKPSRHIDAQNDYEKFG